MTAARNSSAGGSQGTRTTGDRTAFRAGFHDWKNERDADTLTTPHDSP